MTKKKLYRDLDAEVVRLREALERAIPRLCHLCDLCIPIDEDEHSVGLGWHIHPRGGITECSAHKLRAALAETS